MIRHTSPHVFFLSHAVPLSLCYLNRTMRSISYTMVLWYSHSPALWNRTRYRTLCVGPTTICVFPSKHIGLFSAGIMVSLKAASGYLLIQVIRPSSYSPQYLDNLSTPPMGYPSRAPLRTARHSSQRLLPSWSISHGSAVWRSAFLARSSRQWSNNGPDRIWKSYRDPRGHISECSCLMENFS
ncbi:hypothetical protein H4582DRAFT_10416 [Lactarius indigo]|nr:hypothetical protein H4582DRAFT_10416 [Lactarius indigo]